MIIPSHLVVKTHTNFECAARLATLDKLVDRFPLPPVAPPIGNTGLTHAMKLAAHSTSPTPTAMGQSFILPHITLVKSVASYFYYFFVSHLQPAARQFCRSTYTITNITIK
jgi:hypothetical protein